MEPKQRAIESAHPLTPLQEAMLLASIRDPGSQAYQAQCTVEISGVLDPELLAETWRRLIRRHPALRSFFAWEGREDPLQVVRADADLPWTLLDWSRTDPEEREGLWSRLLRDDRDTPFDLAIAPLLRLTLVRWAPERHRLVWSLHHALADGWSGHLVLREMVQEYEGLAAGSPLRRPPPPSFALFVSWLAGRDRQAAEAFWRPYLTDLHDATPLPAAGAAAPDRGRARAELLLPPEAGESMARAAKRLRVTPYTLALGAWALVLDRHTPGAERLTFATTVSERPGEIPGVGGTVGLFLNTIPLRIQAPGDEPLGAWLSTLRDEASEARDHGVGGLGEIGHWANLAPGGVLARSLVVYESFPPEFTAPPEGGSITLESIRISAPSDVPLALLVFPGEPFTLQLEYDTGRYSPAMARRLLRCTARALEGLARPDTRTAAEVDVLDPQDRETLASWSRSPVSEPPVRDVLDLFDQAVRATPDAPAVRDPSTTLTYAELDEAANRLAHRVLRESPEAEHLLGIPADPVAGSIVSILACLKAGRGYVTFDPDQPETRLRQILEHTHRVLARGLDGARTSAIDTRGLDGEPATPPSVERREDRIAYAVFTSGSTGKPKGVVVERGALARSTCARLAWYDTSPGRFLLLSSLAVDSSVAGLYWTLCTGGCLVLPPSRAEQDVAGLGALMKREAVSTTLLVPGLYQALLEGVDPTRLESLDCVVVAGDVCPASLVAHHHRRLPGVRLVNEYGPSEATVWATAGDLETGDEARITIGRPVPFVRLYLLDDAGRRVPPGASGEICLGGDTLARGYLGTDTPDSDRFVADPFRRGGRLYRTGDRGRFREDGRLEFLGRLDHQLKIRGFRVEPGEIERVLQSAPGVVEAAVVRADPATPEVDDLVEALLERAGDDAENLLNRLLERA